jgi:magnesium-transporting ATPase (P-type)
MSTPQKPSAQVHKSEPVGVGAETAGFEGQDEVSVYARATPEHKLRIASHI